MATSASVLIAAALGAVHDDPPSTTFNFLAYADWGDDSPGQHAAAAGMGAVAEDINATMAFALGDNFYGSGCHPTDGVDCERRFKTTFEDVYTAPSLQKIPFYAIAGNHDHGGNVTAQILYSSNPQNTGGRWKFPNYWHNVTQTVEVQGKRVEIEVLLFDSVVMCGNSDRVNPDGTETELKLSELDGPADPGLAKQQLDWLTERMAASTADYLWVGGHYPVWAIGQDPPTGVRNILRSLLNQHEAHYFNGHQHDLEHIVEAGSKVNYVSTGAGKFCCYADKNLDTVPQGSIQFAMSGAGGQQWWGRAAPSFEILSGFTSYRVGPDSMQVYHHAHNGTVLYTSPPILPRTGKPQPDVGPPAPFCSDTTCPHNTRPN